MIVMLRLRLNLLEDDLADRFGISQGTVSKILDRWLSVMASCLKPLIVWPDRETLRLTMPECFREHFGTSVVVVIDCFEIFVQRPSNLKARAQTWSDYKKHNTVKYLIGITPQGTVSFISRAWGGRTPDKTITLSKQVKLIDLFLPGDCILADRGFPMASELGSYRVQVIVPAFMNGRSQLSATDVRTSNEIANVRIHVERIIGFLRRKFRILSSTLHLGLLQAPKHELQTRIDNIVVVCCALLNLCPPIVPMSETNDDAT